MLVEYLVILTTATLLKIKKQASLLLFIGGQVGIVFTDCLFRCRAVFVDCLRVIFRVFALSLF
jgi:hypothetical protein